MSYTVCAASNFNGFTKPKTYYVVSEEMRSVSSSPLISGRPIFISGRPIFNVGHPNKRYLDLFTGIGSFMFGGVALILGSVFPPPSLPLLSPSHPHTRHNSTHPPLSRRHPWQPIARIVTATRLCKSSYKFSDKQLSSH